MRKRGRLQGRSRRRERDEEVRPMEGVANLVDVMLVFACGLMVAIIMYWNINLESVVNVIDQSQLVDITDSENIDESQAAISNYNNLGTAIEDPETGTMFVVEDENTEGSADSEGDDNSDSAGNK